MRSTALVILCVAAVFLAAHVGGRLTALGLGAWYDGLQKPSWTPPGRVIGMVWAVLFTLMAISVGVVAARGWQQPEVRRALLAHAGHLLLNVGWSACFFALRSPGLALAEIVLLAASIAIAILLTAPVSRLAAALLVPYLAWVGFAAFLNLRIVQLNMA